MPHVCGDEPNLLRDANKDGRMPHVCGDEPIDELSRDNLLVVCPTYVGMNRWLLIFAANLLCMPHVCGDEPAKAAFHSAGAEYAPRMWG